jgi:hypothetical protein
VIALSGRRSAKRAGAAVEGGPYVPPERPSIPDPAGMEGLENRSPSSDTRTGSREVDALSHTPAGV